jgi:hypothetical protein
MFEITRNCKHHGDTIFTKTKRSRGDYYECRACNTKRRTNWRLQKKQEIAELYGGKCQCCGYDKCIQAIDFHHIDPKTKKFGINNALKNRSVGMKEVFEELKGCIMVCANCHRELEAGLIDISNIKPYHLL